MKIALIATLCNSAGELDKFSATDLETLQRHLGKRLLNKEWLLAEGDTIIISSREVWPDKLPKQPYRDIAVGGHGTGMPIGKAKP